MKKTLFTFGLFVILVGSGYAQIGKEQEDDFKKFKQQQQQDFQKYKDARDKEFASFLKQRWEEMHPQLAKKKTPAKPKPKKQPAFDRDKVVGITAQKIGISTPKPLTIKPHKINIPKPKVVVEEDKGSGKQLQFSFYNSKVDLNYDANFLINVSEINENAIATYWEKMSDTQYYAFLEETLDIKNSLLLNDWAYYLLLKKVASEIYPENRMNEQHLFVWFVLSKAGYQSKVARIDNGIGLLLPFQNKIYGKPFVTINSTKYYIVSPVNKGARIFTYAKNYPDTDLILDMNIYKPLQVGSEMKSKEFSFSYDGKKYSFDIVYSPSSIALYQDVLSSDFQVYFEGQINEETRQSLHAGLKPIIKGKSEKVALNILLRFVQTAFEYKTDGDQFGREKYFFAEELFHFDYSDCEDRSILFAYLTRDLLDLQVIGLDFPGHIATAVLLNEEVEGDYISYDNKKYLICDPTYINADIGMAMPKFKTAKVEVIPLY